MFFELGRSARAYRKRTQQQIERFADGIGVGVRTKIFGPLALPSTHHHCTWPLLIEREGEKWIALVVAKTYVEARSMLFDEIELQHQRFDFVTYFNPFHCFGCSNHGSCSCVQNTRVLEIVRQPLSQVCCFTYVNDLAVCITKLVRTRRFWNGAGGWFSNHALLLSSNFRFWLNSFYSLLFRRNRLCSFWSIPLEAEQWPQEVPCITTRRISYVFRSSFCNH